MKLGCILQLVAYHNLEGSVFTKGYVIVNHTIVSYIRWRIRLWKLGAKKDNESLASSGNMQGIPMTIMCLIYNKTHNIFMLT